MKIKDHPVSLPHPARLAAENAASNVETLSENREVIIRTIEQVNQRR